MHNGQVIGVVVLNCETDFVAKLDAFRDLAKELAMQIVSQAPVYINIENVPVEVKEREMALAKEKLDGKPEEIQQKIIEGNLQKFYEQTVLMEQVWIKDESKKIKDIFNEVAGKIGEKWKSKKFIEQQYKSSNDVYTSNIITKRNRIFGKRVLTLRTGRANPAILDSVMVEAWGSKVPLNQVASISAPDATLIVVKPFDKSTLKDIEKGIQASDLGLNPILSEDIIRVPVPPLTQETREKLVKRQKK